MDQVTEGFVYVLFVWGCPVAA